MHKIQPKTLFIGKNIVYLPSCHSTNDFASELIQKQSVFEGTIVITAEQTAGRGQRGNSWEAAAGKNITLSLILKPTFLNPLQQFKLNIAISLAIYECLSSFGLEHLKIKWPNDIYVGNQKLGGVLIENSIAGSRIVHAVVGIGLNINQEHFSNINATSLRLATQSEQVFLLENIVEKLCESIEKYYLQLKKQDFAKQHQQYLSILFRFNEPHIFKQSNEVFEAKIIGISEYGLLKLAIGETTKEFDLKEVSYVI